jgi:hypothetical protein
MPAQKVHPAQHSGYSSRKSFHLVVGHGIACGQTASARVDDASTGTRRSSQRKGGLHADSMR